MKKIKLLKWKVGIVGAIGITVFFNTIRTSPEFQQAYLNAASISNSQASITEPQNPSESVPTSPDNSFNQTPNTNDHQGQTTPRYHSKTRRS